MNGTARWGDLTPEEKERYLKAETYEGSPKIESSADADRRRLDWLDVDTERLEDVRGHINNEGGTIREAIDTLTKLQAKS